MRRAFVVQDDQLEDAGVGAESQDQNPLRVVIIQRAGQERGVHSRRGCRRRRCRRDPAWIDGLSIATLDDTGALVGHALLTRAHIGDTAALCLAPRAVLPQYQKTGAGSAAIRAAFDAAKAMGEHFVTVLGHPEYYPRFGFTRASTHGVAMKVSVPDEALMVLSLDGEPLPSGGIRYAAAFDDI